MSLFEQQNTNASNALLDFRAGKMFKDGNLVKPDKRKGRLQVVKGDDDLLHIQWKDRTTGVIDPDLIVMPGSASISKVEKCKTGRVLLLDFTDSNSQHFYWMQEPKDDQDQEYINKINEYINNPPSSESQSSGAGGQQQVQLQDLQQILSGMQGQGGAQTQKGISLRDVLNNNSIVEFIQNNPSVASRLTEYLPEETQINDVVDHFRSPQMQQAIELFDVALQTGQLGAFASSIGLDPSVGGPSGGVEALLQGMVQQSSNQDNENDNNDNNDNNNENREEDQDQDGDTKMDENDK